MFKAISIFFASILSPISVFFGYSETPKIIPEPVTISTEATTTTSSEEMTPKIETKTIVEKVYVPAPAPVVATTTIQTPTINTNDEEIKKVQIKLAELDQLDFEIDNYKPENAMAAVSSATKLNGSALFYAANPLHKWDMLLYNNTSTSWFHSVIQDYRGQLKIQLAGLKVE